MQRLDPVRCAGVAGGEADRRVLVREVLNEWLRSKSSPVSHPPRWDFDARQAWGKLAPQPALHRVLRLRLCQLAVNLFQC